MIKCYLSIFLTAFVLVFFANLGFAQQFKLGLGPELLFPAGNSSNVSGIGVGISARAEMQVSERIGILGIAGYNQFIGRKFLGVRSDNLKYVPVKLGLKYYTDPRFYFEGNLGASLPQNETESNSFAWALGFGSQLGANSLDRYFDIGMRYEGWTKERLVNSTGKFATFGFISFRLTYNFNL